MGHPGVWGHPKYARNIRGDHTYADTIKLEICTVVSSVIPELSILAFDKLYIDTRKIPQDFLVFFSVSIDFPFFPEILMLSRDFSCLFCHWVQMAL